MLLKIYAKKFFCILLALVMILGCTVTGTSGVTAYAAENAEISKPVSYSLSSYSNGTGEEKNTDQHVVLTLKFHETVSIKDEDALNASIFGENPTFSIKIAGNDISSESYHRPCTYSAEDNELNIDIGPCVDADNNPSFTAIYNGSFTALGSLKGIAFGNSESVVEADIAETRIPTGIALEKDGSWDTNSVSVTVSHEANIRGMYHFVIYKVSEGQVIPLTPSEGQMNAYTLTSHAHNFYTMTTADLANNMVTVMNSNLPEGYEAVADGNKITVTSSNEADKLRVYIFDDNFIQNEAKTEAALSNVTLKSTSATLGGNGYVSYALSVADQDHFNFENWANHAVVTVDGDLYTTVAEEPADYTTGDYAYFEKWGSNYYLYLSSAKLGNSGSQTTTHVLSVGNGIYVPIKQNITVKNYAANTFRVRYIDGDGNIITSKAWTMSELKATFKNRTQNYSTLCGMRGVTTFHAQGVLLNDLFDAADIHPDDSMNIQVRTNDSTSQGKNDPDDSVGELNEGYYRMGNFSYSDLYAPRYYYGNVYDNITTYSELGGKSIYEALKSTSGQLIRSFTGDGADEKNNTELTIRKLLADSEKQEVTPLIAWQYSETVFGAGGSKYDRNYDTLASKEKSFRFLFGLKETDGMVSDQTTTWSATYTAFGVDVIAPEDHSVADTEALIDQIGTVTKDSQAAITAAQNAYNALSEDAKRAVKNADVMTKAAEAYTALTTPAPGPDTQTPNVTTPDTQTSGQQAAAPVTVKKATIKKLTSGNRKFKITVKKLKNVNGYQIRYSKKKNMSSAKKTTMTKTFRTIKKLSRGKRYYVQVRAYKLNSAGKRVYGKWSTKKSVKVK